MERVFFLHRRLSGILLDGHMGMGMGVELGTGSSAPTGGTAPQAVRPRVRAAATPAIEPVPMVEARAVARAWRGDSPPSRAFCFCSRVPAVARHQVRNPKI